MWEDQSPSTVVYSKILVAVSLFVVSFGSTLLPLKLINVDTNVFSAGNLLASGILLAAGLVHQLPDAAENLDQSVQFPLAFFLCGLTFVVFLIFEEALHTHCDNLFSGECTQETQQEEHPSQIHPHHVKNGKESSPSSSLSTVSEETIDSTTISSSNSACTTRITHHETTPLLVRAIESIGKCGGISEGSASMGKNCCYHGPEAADDHHDAKTISIPVGTDDDQQSHHRYPHGHGHDHHPHKHHHHDAHIAEHMNGSLLASMILMIALSLHSILESLAIGISTNKADVLSTTIAIIAHKGFAAYALGSSCVASEMNGRHLVVLSFVFSCCSVMGIPLGMLILRLFSKNDHAVVEDEIINTSDIGSRGVAVGIIQAMVSGTFLYVSIVEIGMKELLICRDSKLNTCKKEIAWSKLTAFFLGYVSFSILAIWV